jgi:pyruvate,water dikinase
VPCAEGDAGKIYKGLLKFEKTQTDAGVLPEVGMKVMLNVGNPELAFTFGQLPSDGIGPV